MDDPFAKKLKKQQAFLRGIYAEYYCCLLLRLKGYRILAHRYRTPVGEIDLIAFKHKTLIAIEVKSRASFATALESILPRQCQRITRALQWYLVKNPKHAGYSFRFDIMLVSTWRVRHLQNAWLDDALNNQ